MSEYEPFEAPQGDPWSTEPVGDHGHQRREQSPEVQDDSEVLARVPHLGDESGSDHYRQYGSGGSSQRRHRGPSRRPGIPAPVWVVVGMGLVVLIASPFFMDNNSGDEASVEMPAPDADLAPTWPAGDPNSQWQQPGAWSQEPAPTATATAEPAVPGAWNTGGDWVGAPPNAQYAHNVAENPAQAPFAQDTNAAMPPVGSQPSVGWDTSVAPPSPVEPNYQAMGTPPTQSGYPAPGVPTADWSDRAAAPQTSAQPYPTQPTPNANPWDQAPPTPSLATPQPENVMPGYGTYPTVQPNPYVGNPAPSVPDYQGSYAADPAATRAAEPQYPNRVPNYSGVGQPAAHPYPGPGYPQTARVPNPASPRSSVSPVGPSTYPSPAGSYSYPPTTTSPYTPQTAPAVPTGQPYQGTGISHEASQHSVARLNGTIQEPAARTAYDDSARPSYY